MPVGRFGSASYCLFVRVLRLLLAGAGVTSIGEDSFLKKSGTRNWKKPGRANPATARCRRSGVLGAAGLAVLMWTGGSYALIGTQTSSVPSGPCWCGDLPVRARHGHSASHDSGRRASGRARVLIRSGEAFQKFKTVDRPALDKTGTL